MRALKRVKRASGDNRHRAGKRNAYNKRSEYSPICFSGDVAKVMVDEFRCSNPLSGGAGA